MNNIDFYISDINDGNLALHIGDDTEKVLQNRKNFATKLGLDLDSFVFVNQIHSNIVKNLNYEDRGKGILSIDEEFVGDALVTKEKNIILSILVADCVPIILYDEKNSVVGVVHAGWRGTYGKIIKNTINEMLKIGAKIENLKVIIGPSISKDSYEVGREVGDNFRDDVKTQLVNGKQFLDLKLDNILQAIESGVKESNIDVINVDTFRDEVYFSARRDGFSKGRFGAFIWIK